MPFALTFSGNDKHLLHSCDHIVSIFSQYWYCQIWSEPFYLVGGCRSSYILYAWTIRGTVLQFQSYHRYKLTCCCWLRGIDWHFDCILLNKIMSDIVVQTIFLIQLSIGSSSLELEYLWCPGCCADIPFSNYSLLLLDLQLTNLFSI